MCMIGVHLFSTGYYDPASSIALFPGHSQILSRSCGEPIFLHSCEIKSGSGLGTRLHLVLTYEPLLAAELKRFGCIEAGKGDQMKASVHRVVHTNNADEPAECNAQRRRAERGASG